MSDGETETSTEEWNPDSVIEFFSDGTLIDSYVVDGETKTSTGEWIQHGDAISLQYSTMSGTDTHDDGGHTTWQTEWASCEGTINGDTMSGTDSSSTHNDYEPPDSCQACLGRSYEGSCSYRWSATKIDSGP